jgi:hypothetical protein
LLQKPEASTHCQKKPESSTRGHRNTIYHTLGNTATIDVANKDISSR